MSVEAARIVQSVQPTLNSGPMRERKQWEFEFGFGLWTGPAHAALTSDVVDLRPYKSASIHLIDGFTSDVSCVVTITPQYYSGSPEAAAALTALATITVLTGADVRRMLKPIFQDPTGGDALCPLQGMTIGVDPAVTPTAGTFKVIIEAWNM